MEITLSGGSLRGQNHIMTGDCAVRNLLIEQADKAFLGCSGISPDGEILCGIPTELGINETMIEHAREYYILADHTKIGKTGTFASFSLEKSGCVITDERASADVVEAAEGHRHARHSGAQSRFPGACGAGRPGLTVFQK